MRKQQIKLLERAKKKNCSETQIEFLSREDFTIKELQVALWYFATQSKHFDSDLLVVEAERCIVFLKENRGNIEGSWQYKNLLEAFLPSCYNDNGKDILIGNKKKFRIYKMYCFLLNLAEKHVNNFFNWSAFYAYTFMLYHQFPVWHTKILLRLELEEQERSCNWIFDSYPCLMDDYLHNGKNSFYYYLAAEKSVISDFYPNKNALEKLYNYEKHEFCFQKEEFDTYFIENPGWGYRRRYIEENKEYLIQQELRLHPIITLIGDFCKNSILEPESKNKGIFTKWQTCQLVDQDELKRINDCYAILGRGFTTDIPAFYFCVEISSNFFVTVKYNTYESIYVGANNENGWRINKNLYSKSFMISPDGRLFKKMQNKDKYFPLSMKDFLALYKEKNICGDFMRLLLDFHQEKNIFYKDVVNDCMEKCLIPLTFNEVAEYHNKTDLLLKKYKAAASMQIKWNKQNLNLSYLIIKAYSLVEPGISRRIIMQQKDMALLENWYAKRALDKAYNFLGNILYKNIMENGRKSSERIEAIKERYRKELVEELQTNVLSDEYEQWINERVEEELSLHDIKSTIRDYVSMCRQTKIKVRLDVRSVEQLNNLHDRITTNPNYYRTHTGKVSVPKKSNFLELREILPEEFEWIKTRKRLVLETELQHHCVWSYAELITMDKCAIYSFTDSRAEYAKDGVPRRYTIEFRQRKNGEYYVEQVQGKYDRANADGMREYIQSLLVNYSKLHKESQ